MSSSVMRRTLIVDCPGLIKRYLYFFAPNKGTYYPFDRFCDVLITSIIRTRPSVIYTTTSPPTDHLWRRDVYPEYQSNFGPNSALSRIYSLNTKVLDELQQHLQIVNHIQCPSQRCESGDIIASIIHQYTTKDDEIYVLAQAKKFEQLLSLNHASGDTKRNIHCMKAIKKTEDDIDHDDDANFTLNITQQNQFGLSNNQSVVDYLSLIGISSDNIPGIVGIGPVGAKKLLEFGDIPFLLNNDQWKASLPTQAKLIENKAAMLQLFHKLLIPFERNIELDKNVMNNVKTIEKEFYEDNDSVSLFQCMDILAKKYNLKGLSWRMQDRSIVVDN